MGELTMVADAVAAPFDERPCRVLVVDTARTRAEALAHLLVTRYGFDVQGCGVADLGSSAHLVAATVVVVDVQGRGPDLHEVVAVVRAKWAAAQVLLLGQSRTHGDGTSELEGVRSLRRDATADEVADAIRRAHRQARKDRDGRSAERSTECVPPSPTARLTSREMCVLGLLAEGRSNDDIARDLGVTASTARTHVRNLMRKLGASSRLQAVAIARRNGVGVEPLGGASAKRPSSAVRGPLRVLVGLEDPLLRSALEAVLQGQPDLEVVAELGPAAVSRIASGEMSVDVLLVDDLPSATASAALRLGSGEARTKVVLLSDGTDPAALMAALAAGVNGFLSNECGLAELVRAVRNVDSGGTHVPAGMLGGLLRVLIEVRRHDDAVVEQFSRLSRRENEVLVHLVNGADLPTIAEQLFISPDTARTHIRNILAKTEAHSRLEVVALATRYELVGAGRQPHGSVTVRP